MRAHYIRGHLTSQISMNAPLTEINAAARRECRPPIVEPDNLQIEPQNSGQNSGDDGQFPQRSHNQTQMLTDWRRRPSLF
jgi:hypothetical protein